MTDTSNEINAIRERIDAIDDNVLNLLKERLDCAHRIGKLKDETKRAKWDPLRDDPRFQELIRRMNFPEDEKQ